MSIALLIAAVLLAASQGAWAQRHRTQRTTTSLWLPSRPTSAGNNMYASVITAVPKSTEYLLACTRSVGSPSTCGDFTGVTLTHADGTMRIEFSSDTYVCDRGASATCNITQAGVTTPSLTVLDPAESSAWYTAVTILERQDNARGGAARVPTGSGTSNRNCHRGGKNSKGKNRNSGNGRDPCSGAETLRNGGLIASSLAVGGLLAAVVVFL
ncbi:hypothetical protein ACRALDRAFT_2042721 [Sodiomyces alcalophilus JCM 7366]|uniref:uncharacterized protein n=1 Tax=Sodiomyces alcalophilus JCM 7366 TaxID=591952 RepID=UPI0039B62702